MDGEKHIKTLIFTAITGWEMSEAKRTWSPELFDAEMAKVKNVMKVIKSIK